MPKLQTVIPFEELPYYVREKHSAIDIAKVVRISRTEYRVYFKIGGIDRWYFEDGKWWVETFFT